MIARSEDISRPMWSLTSGKETTAFDLACGNKKWFDSARQEKCVDPLCICSDALKHHQRHKYLDEHQNRQDTTISKTEVLFMGKKARVCNGIIVVLISISVCSRWAVFLFTSLFRTFFFF